MLNQFFILSWNLKQLYGVLLTKYINYNFMNDSSLKMCIDFANKQFDPKLPKGMFYCPYVASILPNGIVYDSTDAIECIRKGVFREIKQRIKH